MTKSYSIADDLATQSFHKGVASKMCDIMFSGHSTASGSLLACLILMRV